MCTTPHSRADRPVFAPYIFSYCHLDQRTVYLGPLRHGGHDKEGVVRQKRQTRGGQVWVVLLTTLLRIRYELYWGLCLGPVQHGGHGEFLFSLIHIYKVTRRAFMIGSPLDNA